ncbi:MAG: septation protein SpoVG family protein [bacterium]|nr:septation protein SpoVG family protein [bacterium]
MNNLKITDIKFYYFDTSFKGGRIRAYADITLNNSLIIRNVQIIETEHGGYFPNYPQKKVKGEWVSYIVFESKEIEKEFREKIIDEYIKFGSGNDTKDLK